MEEYSIGEYIIYRNGEKYELGRIKSLREDGAFVAYHEGETGALTPYSHMHKLINRYCIKDTTLGGNFFKEQTEKRGRVMTDNFKKYGIMVHRKGTSYEDDFWFTDNKHFQIREFSHEAAEAILRILHFEYGDNYSFRVRRLD